MKFLLIGLLCIVATTAYIEDDLDFPLYENEVTPLQELIQRIKERVQAAWEHLKELVAKHKETISAALKEKIEAVKQKLAELALEHGGKILEKLREVAGKIRAVIREVTGGETDDAGLYAIEDEQTLLERVIKGIQTRLQAFLDRAKALIDRHQEIKEVFKDKIEEITTAIGDLAKEKGLKLKEAIGKITRKIGQLFEEVKAKIGISNYYVDIKEAAKTLRDFFSSEAGIAALKENAKIANPSTQTGVLIQSFILASTPEALKELIRELFKNVSYAPVGEYEDIRELVKKAVAWLQTNEGINAIRQYAKDLETSHPVVLRLKDMLEGASNDEVKSLMKDIFDVV